MRPEDDLIAWLRATRPELLDRMARADYVPDWEILADPETDPDLKR